ncbi:pseudouridine synthase [Mediannikoviicoccus vaginalis]|uniref:pseudouridine synthase n=1 Tax=Mediannikoviicoccus vaginalis TaxID=2899727 RepID=UPI001F2EAE72|nr:pseudouridine synthase [Mediannikoviicoccus vaginalis]
MRINKYLAHSGVCSRRQADEIISQGRVSINEKTVKELGTKVLPDDVVKFDGNVVAPLEKFKYFLLNKPVGYVSTVKDPFAEKTVIDLIDSNERLYPVGRLDKDSRGIIIITNDGELTYKLTHPKKDIFKTYEVILDKKPKEVDLDRLKKGIPMDGYLTKRAKIKKISNLKFQISISEGRNRQVRRMFDYIGCKVIDLKRISIGKISDKNLPEGEFRKLTKEELDYLRSL